MPEKEVGKITHYFNNISVAAINITKGSIKAGDVLHIKGHSTDFTQPVDSMQIEKEIVKEAKKGASIGIKVKEKVRDGDTVYIVKE